MAAASSSSGYSTMQTKEGWLHCWYSSCFGASSTTLPCSLLRLKHVHVFMLTPVKPTVGARGSAWTAGFEI